MKDSTEVETKSPVAAGQPDFVRIEHEILDFWSKENCFKKLQEKLSSKPFFRFLDGPVTANNPLGVHHALGRSLKDMFLRFKALTGHDCQFQNGFDCQGLWVEVEVEKDLGFKGKPDIEAYGLDKFSEACKARVQKFSSIQTKQSIRLGQWMDWNNSYYTHTDQNIQGIWKFLKKCHQNGWLYRSHVSMPWCARCGTSLSEHEMTGSYKDLKHLAVFMKLLVPALKSRILVWTTTPWTLPANTALAVNPSLEYSQVSVDGEDLPVILCSEVLSAWMKGNFGKRNPKVLKTFSGAELAGFDYEPIFADIPVQTGFEHKIVPWSQVDPSEGTGVVHIAPGCGREDFELSNEIHLTQLLPCDEKGDYVSGYGFLEGKNVQKVADEVTAYLESHGKLFSKYMHEHSYPVCWRCKEELIFRLVDEWYISTDEIRPKLMAATKKISWQPEHLGKRMEDWLQNMGDWCISRKRFWGLPLPFYVCPDCKSTTVVESRDELQSLSPDEVSKVHELHRPWIDSIKVRCASCGKLLQRVSEVGDCWLDAGIVSYATKGCYDRRNVWAPADLISEMSEQVRLWFYSVLFMGVTLGEGETPPYKQVVTYERVRAEDGAKFSKTGYMIHFDEAAEKMGVDTMRLIFATQPPTMDMRFGYSMGDETRRDLLSLWNVFSFFNTYAEIDKPSLDLFKESDKKLQASDYWLLASLFDFARKAKKHYEEYNTPAVVREYERFIDGLSNWYIRSNRRRFWKSESSADKLTGYWVLFQTIRTTALVMSPIIPFITEKIWQDCVRRYETGAALSIHLADWPELPASWADDKVIAEVDRVRQIINLAHRLRAESGIKVRQPLSALYALVPEDFRAACVAQMPALLGELNLKRVEFLNSKEQVFSEYLELDLKKAGPVLKADVGKVVTLVNGLSREQSSGLIAKIKTGQAAALAGYEGEIPAAIFAIKTRSQEGLLSAEENGLFLALDTRITKELTEEGWIRDILRLTQVLRKDSGLDVSDRIRMSVDTGSSELAAALKANQSLIESETLSSFSLGLMEEALGQTEVSLSCGDARVYIGRR